MGKPLGGELDAGGTLMSLPQAYEFVALETKKQYLIKMFDGSKPHHRQECLCHHVAQPFLAVYPKQKREEPKAPPSFSLLQRPSF
jgi:hypothetical protein